MSELKAGDRVFITDQKHPWVGCAGELIAYEKYGLGWMGWRMRLDGNCGESYVNANQVMGPGRVDSIRITTKKRKVKK